MFLATAVDTARLWRSEWIWPTPRWIRRIFQTKAETAQPRIKFSRPRRRRRVFSDQGGNGATLQNKRRGRYFPDQRGDGATKKNFPATAMHTARPFIPGWRRPDFPDQDRVSAFFQTKREMPRFSRPRRRRRNQESIHCARGGYGATLAIRVQVAHTKLDTARISRPGRRRRDQENIPRNRGEYGATFLTRAETA